MPITFMQDTLQTCPAHETNSSLPKQPEEDIFDPNRYLEGDGGGQAAHREPPAELARQHDHRAGYQHSSKS